MNERIGQLAIRCSIETGSYEYGSRPEFDYEKFAELIVRECANRASWAQDTNEQDIGGEVLKHFGVEE